MVQADRGSSRPASAPTLCLPVVRSHSSMLLPFGPQYAQSSLTLKPSTRELAGRTDRMYAPSTLPSQRKGRHSGEEALTCDLPRFMPMAADTGIAPPPDTGASMRG